MVGTLNEGGFAVEQRGELEDHMSRRIGRHPFFTDGGQGDAV